jgi:phosphoglycolate phosphatase-like HAD superfamily hydrolase
MKNKKTTILFDFDGTLAETMMLIYRVFNQLSGTYKYKPLSEEEIEVVRHFTIYEFIDYVKLAPWKIPVVAIHARKLMHSEIHTIQPPEGLVEVLTKIHESGRYKMDILTSNRRKNVLSFLNEHKMGWFDQVHATRSILSKKLRLKKYIKSEKIDPKNLYYVGDTSVDIESTRFSGAKSVAVSWGLNTYAALERAHPDYLVKNPSELLQVFPI